MSTEDVPSFFKLHGLFSAWPGEYRQLVQDQPDLKEQLKMLNTTPSAWEKEVYETLDLSMPELESAEEPATAVVPRGEEPMTEKEMREFQKEL